MSTTFADITTRLSPDTMFEKSQQTGLDYVLRYNPDRFLAPAYRAAGKTPKASVYGGWESRQIQGHMLGHYLSALSGFYVQTGSEEAKKKLDYTVSCLKSIQRKDGYIGGIPSTPFDTVFNAHGDFQVERFSLASWWVPWYSVHKIYAGLIDAYTYGKNSDALEIVKKMADWAIAGTKKMSDTELQKMLECEHGGMCKVFADLYGITGEKKYLAEAERWIHREIMDPCMKEVDRLQGYHANTQIPKFLGIARLYELTGKEEYKTAATFFYNTVTQKRSYAIGGNSKGEHFGREYDETLACDTCETCNTYNMLELAEHIFAWTKDSSVADYYEKALYNHILASQDPESGAKTYFVSMLPGFYKVYCTHDNAMWCCTGTGLENPERYNRFIAADIDGTIYVNLFIPSTFTTEDGWKLQIETNFPFSQQAQIKLLSRGKNPRQIKVRVPSWVQEKTGGDSYKTLALSKDGDSENIELPMSLSTRRTRDRSGNFSVLYGPIVLAADLGKDDMPNDTVDDQLVYMNFPASAVQKISANLATPAEWIDCKDSTTLTFATKPSACADGKTSYTLRPFFNIHHVRYATYFPSSDAKEDERTAKYESITMDFIEPGRQQSEMEHHFKTANTQIGYMPSVDRNYRTLSDTGTVTYKVRVTTASDSRLILTVHGSDIATLTVTLGKRTPVTIPLDGTHGDTLYDIDLPLTKPTGKAKAAREDLTLTSTGPVHLMEIRSTK